MGDTYRAIVIDAPAAKVRAAIRDFHDARWAPGVITRLDIVGDRKGLEIGARRILNGAFHETLREMDDDERRFADRIDDGPSPVSRADVGNCTGRVSVRPVTGGRGTFVEWSSTWDRNEAPVAESCHSIHVALLAEMKKSLER